MTGKKNRSGKIHTPEAMLARNIAASKGGRARADAARDAEPPLAPSAKLPGACVYDALVKEGKITYALARTREQVVEQTITNEIKSTERDKVRGELVTRVEAESALYRMLDDQNRRFDRALGLAGAALAKRFKHEDVRAILDALEGGYIDADEEEVKR